MALVDASLQDVRAVQVGNYKFTGKVLGKGSFAVVEEAIHIPLKTKVSVKTIDLLKCNAYITRHLSREAIILRQLDHPHIVRLFEALKFGTKYCLVTEHVEGWNLCTFIRNQKSHRLEELLTRKYTRQIVAALAYLHRKSIVHRDLKLDNIMLDSSRENIKIVDFGLSNHWLPDCPLSTPCGSPEYCAPELFEMGTKYGPEVDMWALGVILYGMAVGSLPFPCVTSLLKVPDKRNSFIIIINRGLSNAHVGRITNYAPEFITLIKGLISPKPEDRLTVEEVLTDNWVSNRNHWTPVQIESLDPYEISFIRKRVCGLLEMNEERLKADMTNDPSGRVAAFFNIMVYNFLRPRLQHPVAFPSTTDSFIKQVVHSTKSKATMFQPRRQTIFSQSKGPRTSIVEAKNQTNVVQAKNYTKVTQPKSLSISPDNNVKGNKLWVVGVANRINEVVKSRKPLQRGVYTATASHQQSFRTSGSTTSDSKSPVTFASGDSTSIDHFAGPKAFQPNLQRKSSLSFISRYASRVHEGLHRNEVSHSQLVFKRESAELFQPSLSTKFNLKARKCT